MQPQTIPYIFIDIDGVFVKEDRPGEDTFDINILVPTLEASCITHFAHIVDQYETVRIVISSSWREVFDIDTIMSRFPPLIRRKIVGATPIFSSTWSTSDEFFRHQEVLHYLNSIQAADVPWIAIDDIAENYPPGTPMVVTDPYEGFDETSAVQLDKYLKNIYSSIPPTVFNKIS